MDGTPLPDLGDLRVVAGNGPRVHLFLTGRGLTPGTAPRVIEHRILENDRWIESPPIRSKGGSITKIESAGSPRGDVLLAWAEGSWPEQTIHLGRWSGGAWSDVQTVSDPHARPLILRTGEMNVHAGREGEIDIFWIDTREDNFLQGLLTMGHGGSVSKVSHRRWKDGRLTEPVRVQKRGPFDVENLSAVFDDQDRLHLFWIQEGRWPWWRSGLLHSSLVQSRWGRPDKVGDLPPATYTSHEFIDQMQAIPAIGGGLEILWSHSTYERTKRGEQVLEIWQRREGAWERSTLMRHRYLDFKCPLPVRSSGGIFVQTCTHAPSQSYKGHDEPWEHPIVYLPRDGDRFGGEQPLVALGNDGGFDAAIGADGLYHLVYTTRGANDEWTLLYVRGIPSGP
jgi:hypothetical protein